MIVFIKVGRNENIDYHKMLFWDGKTRKNLKQDFKIVNIE